MVCVFIDRLPPPPNFFTLMKPCMPGRNRILLNLIYFENLFRDIGFSSSYCFVPVYLSF